MKNVQWYLQNSVSNWNIASVKPGNFDKIFFGPQLKIVPSVWFKPLTKPLKRSFHFSYGMHLGKLCKAKFTKKVAVTYCNELICWVSQHGACEVEDQILRMES